MEKLPVNEYENQIVEAVRNNNVVILNAETGSGKSTQVPQMLERAGYDVIVTQPRRIASRTVAHRVAVELNCKIGEKVGYMTAYEKEISSKTRILFCTDGLQLVREIIGIRNDSKRERILVIDEVHEWNLNIETLVAWTRLQLELGNNMKLVIMSATLEAENLANFYGTSEIIKIPGNLFEVKDIKSTGNIVSDVLKLVQKGRNVLVFQPGKKEIDEVIASLKLLQREAVVLPLHGEMEINEQNKCFVKYSIPKVVVATNVAQTSITIPDIDAVVDSAKEKRIELKDGIESLVIEDISRADAVQRKGRAGRVKPGVYVYASDTKYEELDEYTLPEINRLRLDQIVLRLATIEIDAEKLEFFHQPNIENIKDAKRLLKDLGALTKDGKVTELGMQMARFPTSVRSARMLVEAQKENVLYDMIDIVSIYEAGGIKNKEAYLNANSELIAQFKLFKNMNEKIKKIKNSKRDLRDINLQEKNILWYNINSKSYYRALEIRRKLMQSIEVENEKNYIRKIDEKALTRSCITGFIDNIFISNSKYEYWDCNNNVWKIDRLAAVKSGTVIIGMPKIITYQNKYKKQCTMPIITWPISVDIEELSKIIPEKCLFETIYKYDECLKKSYKIKRCNICGNEKIISKTLIDNNDEHYYDALANFLLDVVYNKINLWYIKDYPYITTVMSVYRDVEKTKEELFEFFRNILRDNSLKTLASINKHAYDCFIY